MLDHGRDKRVSGAGPPSFDGIVGQRGLKKALLAVATDDALDGLLVRGEKGTAKSTAVRALAGLLPSRPVVADCPYGCPPDEPARACHDCRDRVDPPTVERPPPLVTLPLGATRERVVGSLSVADALEGEPSFEPGLLARANGGLLYVDEVNLLDDHLVDLLLDAAASGINRVERDGVSVVHPAEFTLVGTMNPEEGDLRPQLRDRFALSTTVTACDDVDDRVRIVERALDRTETTPTDGDPAARLREARARVDAVELPREFLERIAGCCREAGVDGHRADVAATRAARAVAALDGRGRALESDARRGLELALPHRLRADPFDDAPDLDDLLDERFDRSDGTDDAEGEAEADGDEAARSDDGGDGDESGGEAAGADRGGATGDGDGEGDEPERDPGEPERGGDGGRSDADDRRDEGPAGGHADEAAGADREGADGGGESDGDDPTDGDRGDDGSEETATPLVPGASRSSTPEPAEATAPALDPGTATGGEAAGDGRAETERDETDGPRVRTRRTGDGDGDGRIDAAASVRAAGRRGADAVGTRDLRESVRTGTASALVTFVVDASASMRPAMRAAKGTVLALLRDAYEERDEVAFVAFAGDDAEVLLPPTDSVALAARHLKELPTGDRTPLPAGLRTARRVVETADPAASVVVLVTDGRANVADGSPTAETRAAARALADTGSRVVVVDAGEDERGLLGAVLDATDGERVPLAALSDDRVADALAAARRS